MASDVELKKIKKKYGEKFMHMCRDLFPTILEHEGALFATLERKFANNSRTLYEDIHNNELEEEFKDFIYKIFEEEQNTKAQESEQIKTPYELLDEAGYALYECETEKEIQRFKKYYAPGEVLCTFNGGRLDRCVVFFAVKKNVDEIKRENFEEPKREDEYGTSVMSIQFSRGSLCTVSIKNRYNHTVNNPDATYSNDLDRIIAGLSLSFKKLLAERDLNLDFGNIEEIDIPNYVVLGDGKYYKYNFEMDWFYYCPGNIVIEGGEAIKIGEPEKVLLVENFVIDMVNKTISQYYDEDYKDSFVRDSFIDDLQDIEKIEILRDKTSKDGERVIIIKKKDTENTIEIRIDRDNQIIGYKNLELKEVGSNFLYYNRELKYLELPMLGKAEDNFLYSNKALEQLDLPNLVRLGDNFLFQNTILCSVKLQLLEIVGDNFLRNNDRLESLDLPHIFMVGGDFMRYNIKIRKINMPNLKTVYENFMRANSGLEELSLPKLRDAGLRFLSGNKGIKSVYLPNLEEAEDYFLDSNKELTSISLPKLRFAGEDFLSANERIMSVEMPSLETVGENFMLWNRQLKELKLPSLENAGSSFLPFNEVLTQLELPSLENAGSSFLHFNKVLTQLELPSLTSTGCDFMPLNDNLQRVILPRLKLVGDNFLGSKWKKITPEHLARLDKEKGMTIYDIGEGKQIVLGLQVILGLHNITRY